MDWKSILEKVIVAVVAGVILAGLAWAGSRLLAPSSQVLSAQTDWIDIPNPAFGEIDAKKSDMLEALGSTFFGVKGLSAYAYAFRGENKLRAGRITIKNFSDSRSKQVEISDVHGIAFSKYQTQTGLFGLKDKLVIQSIEPNKSIEAFYISLPWFSSTLLPFSIIHDDRIVEVLSVKADDIPFISPSQATTLVATVLFLTVIGGLTVFALLVMGVIFLFVHDRLKFQAWNLSPKQVRNWMDVIEAVKKHYPEKLPSDHRLSEPTEPDTMRP